MQNKLNLRYQKVSQFFILILRLIREKGFGINMKVEEKNIFWYGFNRNNNKWLTLKDPHWNHAAKFCF